MCKHRSGGMSKSSATNQNSGSNENNTSALSTSTSVPKYEDYSDHLSDSVESDSTDSNMAIGSPSENSSTSSKGYDSEQTEIQCNMHQNIKNDIKTFENWYEQSKKPINTRDSEKTPMLQNQELMDMLPATSSWHNYQIPTISDEASSKSSSSESSSLIKSLHPTSSNTIIQEIDFSNNDEENTVNNYLKLQNELKPLFNASCDFPFTDNNLVDVNQCDEGPFSALNFQKESFIENWLFAAHQKYLPDEVQVHQSNLSKDNFQDVGLSNKSLVGNSNSDLLADSSMNVGSDSFAMQRQNSLSTENEPFQCHSFNLSPSVNFAVYEMESSSETDVSFTNANPKNTILQDKRESITHSIILQGSSSTAQMSLFGSYSDIGGPICKICHMTARDDDPLISPCRCSGTMQYIHCGCLMRWLEISSKKSRKQPSCELCQYQYHWHKKFKVRHWQFPHCSRRDITLHIIFLLAVMVMIACAAITILCFKQDKGTKIDQDRTELTNSEIITLICGVLFFLAFFVGMYVEVKARNTLYKLLVKFFYLNQQWYIDEYSKKENSPVSV